MGKGSPQAGVMVGGRTSWRDCCWKCPFYAYEDTTCNLPKEHTNHKNKQEPPASISSALPPYGNDTTKPLLELTLFRGAYI